MRGRGRGGYQHSWWKKKQTGAPSAGRGKSKDDTPKPAADLNKGHINIFSPEV